MSREETYRRLNIIIGSIVFVAWSILPFVWLVLTSVKSPEDVLTLPPVLPTAISLFSFKNIFTATPFARYIINSLVVSSLTTILVIATTSLAAYAITRLEFKGKLLVLFGVLSVSMFPQISILSFLYSMMKALGFINTYPALVFPYTALTIPLALWLLVSYFRSIPKELDKAALIDGCPKMKILFKIILPLAAPGIFSTALLVFIFSWNEFMFALALTIDKAARTVPVGIALFEGTYRVAWGDIAAASVVVTLPLIFLVLILQRRIISGLTLGAIKG